MSEDEDGGDMGRPADGVLVRPLPIPDVAWMLDRVPVMGEDGSSGVTGPAGTRINVDVRRPTRKSRMNRKKRDPISAKDHRATLDWLLRLAAKEYMINNMAKDHPSQ